MTRRVPHCLLALTFAFGSASAAAQAGQSLNSSGAAQVEVASRQSCDLMALSPRPRQFAIRQTFAPVLSENATCLGARDAQCADRVLAQVDVASLSDSERALFVGQQAEIANLRGDREGTSRLFREALDHPAVDAEVKALLAQRYANALLTQNEFATALRVLATAFDCDTWTANALVLRAAAYQQIFAFALAMESVDAAIRLHEVSGRPVPAVVSTMRQQLADELAKPPRPPTLPGRSSHPDMVGVFRSNPDYPQRALERGLSGCVKLEFAVSEHGEVESVRVIESTSELFEQAAVAALQQWRYVPRLINGLPIRVAGIQTTFLFELEGAGKIRSQSACRVDVPISP